LDILQATNIEDEHSFAAAPRILQARKVRQALQICDSNIHVWETKFIDTVNSDGIDKILNPCSALWQLGEEPKSNPPPV